MPRLLLLCLPALAGCLAAQAPTAPSGNVDWKDLTKSGLPIRFYGFFRLDAYYNTARMNSVILPATVLPENGVNAKPNDDQSALDPRLTRFGFDITPQPVGDSQVSGKLETDFANFPSGSSESRATPRIRLAYMNIHSGELDYRIGQDWDTISPLYPAVNHELLMWNAGNTGDRRAQIRTTYKPEGSSWDLAAALGLTGAINNQDLDGGGERDGFDSGLPHLQVRAGLQPIELVDEKPGQLGLWGAVGRTETDTQFGGETRFDVWLAGADLQLPLTDALTLRGEAWVGQNLGDFRGGIGQTINTATGEEIGSIGGWGELVFKPSKPTQFHIGGSCDDPDNDDLATDNPSRNLTGYIGTVHQWENGVTTGFDVIYWETDYIALESGNAVRFNLWFKYDF